MSKLSDTSAVRAARRALTELDAAGDDAYHIHEIGPWLGRTKEALRLVLAEIDRAEEDGGTP